MEEGSGLGGDEKQCGEDLGASQSKITTQTVGIENKITSELDSDTGLALGEVLPGAASRAKVRLRLTRRDYEIFSFLLDQKFASLESLYFRFFDGRKESSDPLPENLWVARQRLGMLKRAGLVNTERVYSESKSLYLLSGLGFHALQSRMSADAYSHPVKQVDFRNYEHDQAVTYCRIAIEKGGKCLRWFSDRRLRMQGFEVQGISQELPSTVVPDGILISSKGERIAFEFEGTPRKKSRYEWKVSQYAGVLGPESLLQKVLFVGGTPRVHSDLQDVLQGQRSFWLESYAHFLGRLFPSGQAEQAHRQLKRRLSEDAL